MAHPERSTRHVADPEHVTLRELGRRQGIWRVCCQLLLSAAPVSGYPAGKAR